MIELSCYLCTLYFAPCDRRAKREEVIKKSFVGTGLLVAGCWLLGADDVENEQTSIMGYEALVSQPSIILISHQP